MKQQKYLAVSLTEILIALAIISIVAGISFVSAKRQLTSQKENAVVSNFKQIILEGTTAASARGVETVLFRDNNKISLLRSDNNEEIDSFLIPATVSTNLPRHGVLLAFSPHGWVDEASLAALPNPFAINTGDGNYAIRVSLIGEIDIEVH